MRDAGLCSLYTFLPGYLALPDTYLELSYVIDVLEGTIQNSEENSCLREFVFCVNLFFAR